MTKEETANYLARLPVPLYGEIKAAAMHEGRTVSAIVEDALTAYVAQRTSGTSLLTSASTFSASYSQPDLSNSARVLRSTGLSHEDIIAKLGGSTPAEGE